MYIKKNARVTFRSNRRSNFKRNNNFSNNKSRNKGNVTQQYNKYLKLAKEASSSGDRIQSEYYYQFTDHYYRLMVEMGISVDDNSSNETDSSENALDEVNILDETNNAEEEKKDVSESSNEENQNSTIEESNQDIESIESIPFISEPIKKKTSSTKKKVSA